MCIYMYVCIFVNAVHLLIDKNTFSMLFKKEQQYFQPAYCDLPLETCPLGLRAPLIIDHKSHNLGYLSINQAGIPFKIKL